MIKAIINFIPKIYPEGINGNLEAIAPFAKQSPWNLANRNLLAFSLSSSIADVYTLSF